MDESQFDYLFPYKDSTWTYEKFLIAAAHYPRFCNRKDRDNNLTFTETCRRELAVLLAHIATDTNEFDESNPIIPVWRQGLSY